MFFRRKRREVPAEPVAPAAPVAADAPPSIFAEVKASRAVFRDRPDPGDVARIVLNLIREHGDGEAFYAVFEIDKVLAELAERHGWHINFDRVREAIKKQPGVHFSLTRFLNRPEMSALRSRIARHYASQGLKCPGRLHIFTVELPLESYVRTPETVSETVVQAHSGRAAAAAPAEFRNRRTTSRNPAGSSGGIDAESTVFAGPSDHPARSPRQRAA